MAPKRKATIRELEGQIEDLQGKFNIMVQRVDQFLNMFVAELEKHNTIISKMLEAQGLMHAEVCPKCEGTIRTPVLEGIEPVDDCPYCGHVLRESEQTTLPLEEE
jgi:rubrerythrin